MTLRDRSLPPVIARRLGALLNFAAEGARQAGDEVLEPLGLDVKLFGVLTFLRHESEGTEDGFHDTLTGAAADGPSDLSQQAVAERLRIDRTTMVAVVDKLEGAGLVHRERNPSDRRAYIIRITPKGLKLQRQAVTALDQRAETFFEPLAKRDRDVLGKLLLRLVEREPAD